MSTDVVMPKMGESITEGTIVRWLKQVGDEIERDEFIFEISTDKVDVEVPSPVAGTLTEIKVKEGETVEVDTVVAIIGEGNGAGAAAQATQQAQAPAPQTAPPVEAAPAPAPQPAATTDFTAGAPASVPPQQAEAQQAAEVARTTGADQVAATPVAPPQIGTAPMTPPPHQQQQPAAAQTLTSSEEQSLEELRRTRSSPVVRNIAREHNIDISQLEGTGASGRVTKSDILSYIEQGSTPTAQPSPPQTPPQTQAPQPSFVASQVPVAPQQLTPSQQMVPASPPLTPTVESPAQIMQPGAGDRVEQMSVMRRKIAEHMTMSLRTSAHVTTVYEIDMTRIARLRDEHKYQFQQNYGTKLTFMPFIFQAVISALRQFPIFNAQVSSDQIIYKREINLGMAVALDWGLIVPVIKRADELSLAGLARTANDLADRARAKQLKPDEVAGGTFTITNPGVFGGLYGTPIINQPQVAILAIGTIEKRPRVMTDPEGNDYLAIRTMSYFALSYDHRIIDGADAERFLGYTKATLEAGQFTL